MRIYNSLTRKVEEIVPFKDKKIGMYACGPTVYDFAHIGHGRKYVMDDVLVRVLKYFGYSVKHVMNITDVGHLVSDADEGEDKLEKGAKKFGKTVWEVADFFEKTFWGSMDKLNIKRPDIICKATDHIKEQLELVQKLIDKGFAYDTPEAVYFEINKFSDYEKLFAQNLKEKLTAVREEVQTGEHKKNPADFALWFKRVGKFADHTMHWESPWGDGFPGWHLECSAMSMKYLGEQFEIHTGGEDHLSIHHPNEIAQSEAATGKKPFVKYWIHHTFLMVDGRKMSKSLDNVYQVEDLEKKGIEPLALRYLYLSTHYKKQMNFTFVSVTAAQEALNRLRRMVNETDTPSPLWGSPSTLEGEKWKKLFEEAIADDLNTPEALAVMWKVIRSGLKRDEKLKLVNNFDQILGLNLETKVEIKLSDDAKKLIEERQRLRSEQKWEEADKIRQQLVEMGVEVGDKKI